MRTRWLVLMLALVCGTAYARKYPLTATESVPGARGDVDVDKDNNGNTRVKMKVEFLSPPASLTPPATTYILWIRERGSSDPAMQAGQLRVDKDRKAEFETVTPSKNFDLFVTAEQDPLVRQPTGMEVLRATIQP